MIDPPIWPGSGSRHQLGRALLDRNVLERALHLIAPRRVRAAVVEVLGDRAESHPLAPGLLPAVPRPRKMARTCSIARSRVGACTRAGVLLDHPRVAQDAMLEWRLMSEAVALET
jgi:hypothetical protein